MLKKTQRKNLIDKTAIESKINVQSTEAVTNISGNLIQTTLYLRLKIQFSSEIVKIANYRYVEGQTPKRKCKLQ